jgi:glucosamine--fructose-6-phosphate aminotransferase (isomerizing)
MTYMLDEIRQQPDVVRRILAEEYPSAEALAAEVRRRKIASVYVAARGTSENAALYCKYLLEIQHGLPVALAAPSVFTLLSQTSARTRSCWASPSPARLRT